MNYTQNINIENGTPELMENAARIFLERLSDRKCILEIPLILKVDRNLPDEGFRIASVYKQGVKTLNDDVIGHKLIDCGIQVSGANESGVLYGLGKLLRNGSFKDGRFRPGSWRGVSSPAKPYRIVYLAPHFYNYYQCAPLDELKKYLEDLALLGFNGLKLGLPGSLFSSNDQPSKLPKVLNAEACLYFMSGGKEERETAANRINVLHAYGKKLGMKTIVSMGVNSGFPDTPVELRAVPPMRSYHYYDICPSAPGGLELILKNTEKRITVGYKDIEPDFILAWPYDEGGCACPACSPWGYNGMFRTTEKLLELYRKYFPNGKIIYGTWLFDHKEQGEWAGLYRRFADGEGRWCDLLLADSHGDFPAYPLEHGLPEGKGLITFPEISMWGRQSWGEYGATAMPRRFFRLFHQSNRVTSGFKVYSEGRYEDINKEVVVGLYVNPSATVEEILRSYASFYMPGTDPNDFVKLCGLLEDNHEFPGHKVTPDFSDIPEDSEELAGYRRRAAEACRIADRMQSMILPSFRSSWRWRLVFLRAMIDREIFAERVSVTHHRGPNGGPIPDAKPDSAKPYFDEVHKIYGGCYW